MLVDMPIVHMMQVTIVQVVDMAVMQDGLVPATRAMNVSVIAMLGVGACGHR